jgi:hypothetical protein
MITNLLDSSHRLGILRYPGHDILGMYEGIGGMFVSHPVVI